jgi:hypothetical protein
MRSGLSQAQEQALMRSAPEMMSPAPAPAPTTKEIPYDYVAKFKLLGKQGNRVQDVINISIEGGFVAVAIGYSFIPVSLGSPLPAIPVTTTGSPIGFSAPSTTLVEIIADTIAGKLTLQTTDGAVTSTVDQAQTVSQLASIIRLVGDPRMLLQCLLLRLCGIDFKYSIVDSGTGRELQNQPIHNIAGLGESTGDRPFRPLAKPMLFLPRSTIRIEVEEISEGPIYTGAELFIVLHGYKMLGYGTALP